MNIRRPWRVALASLVAGSALGAACSHDETAETTMAGVAASVTVQSVRQQDIQETVNLQGTVVPAISGEWVVYAPERARIDQLPKPEGAAVATGDVLVKFEIGELTQDLAAKQGAVSEA